MSQADIQYNRALQDAISTLLTTSKKSEENLDLAQFLFKDAYLRQEQNKDQLESLGIALPEEYKTGNYADFVQTSGNRNVMRTLGGMYGQAVRNDELLTDAITTFNRGQREAQELEKAGAGGTSYYDYTTEEGEPSSYLPEGYGQVSLGEYQINPEEIVALAKKEDIAPEDYVNEVYMAGFNKGTRSQENAMAMLQTDQSIEQTRFNLNAGKLEFASQSNNQTIGLIGTTITNNMFEEGLGQLIAYKGILQVEGGVDKFAEFIEDIIDQGAWPDIQGELIGALQQYAGAGTNADIHKGFVQMTSNAYQFLRVIEERQKLAIENKTILPNEFGMINEHDIKLLRSLDPAYNDAYNRIEQYKSLGIPIGNQKVLQQAFMSSQIESNLIDAYNKMGEGNLSTVSRDLNITKEALYEQVDWMPEETYSNTISGIIAADAYNNANVPVVDPTFGEEIEGSEYEDILGGFSGRSDTTVDIADKEAFVSQVLAPANFTTKKRGSASVGILDPNSDIHRVIQSGKKGNNKRIWKRLERALNDYAETSRMVSSGFGKEESLQEIEKAIYGLLDDLSIPHPGLFGMKPFETLFGRGY